jgi:spermidine synthase
VLGSTLVSFALVVGALLLAYALGSLGASLLLPRLERGLALLGWVVVGLGLSTAATVLLFRYLECVIGGGGLLASFAGRGLLSALVVGVPGLLMGVVLPAATAAVRDDHRLGRGVGALYLANTAGNILGSLAAGYLLIPALGAGRSLVAVGALGLAVGVAALATRTGPGRRWTAAVAIVGSLALVALWLGAAPGATRAVLGLYNPHARLTWAREGLRGTVTVFDVPPLPVLQGRRDDDVLRPVAAGYRMLAVNGVDVAGTSPDLRTTQRMQAHVPLLLHGAPRRVLQVGFGSGETAREALRHGLESLEVAEVNPDVVAEAARWFPGLQPDRFTARFGDARIVVSRSRERFDAVLNDSTYPGLAGSSQLYSADHFRACRALLEEGGVVSTWLPIDLPPETFRMVLASFTAVFPEASFWLPANCWNKHGVLVGTVTPQAPRLERVRQGGWPEAVRASLEELGYGDPEAFASMRVLGPEEVRRLASGAPVNDDDHPLLEYPVRGPKVSGEELWTETLRLLLKALGPPARLEAAAQASKGARMEEAARLVLAGELALLDGDADMALRFYRRAHLVAPAHPGPNQLTRDILVFRAQEALSAGRGDEAKRLLAEAFAGRLSP